MVLGPVAGSALEETQGLEQVLEAGADRGGKARVDPAPSTITEVCEMDIVIEFFEIVAKGLAAVFMLLFWMAALGYFLS